MSWLFGQKNEKNDIRNKQVETLLATNPTIKLLDSTRSSFELTVNTRFGDLPFRILLPQRFPEEPPQIHVPTPVVHRWVDRSYNVVGHPSLQKWSPRNHLGRIVKEIYNEFYTNPPTPYRPPVSSQGAQQLTQVTPVPSSQGSAAGLSGTAASSPPQLPPRPRGMSATPAPEQKASPAPPPKTQPPRLPDSFPEVEALSEVELELLLEKDEYLTDFATALKSSKEFLSVKAELTAALKQSTEKTLSREGEMLQLAKDSSEIRSRVEAKQAELAVLRKRQEAVAEIFSLRNILHALKEAIDEAEEEAESLRSKYKDQSDDDDSDNSESEEEEEEEDDEEGGSSRKRKKKKKKKKLSAAQFASKFTKLRQRVHELSGKRERLKDVYLRSGNLAGMPPAGAKPGRGGAGPPMPAPRPQILLGGMPREGSLRMLI